MAPRDCRLRLERRRAEPILLGFNAGPVAERLGRHTDEEVVKSAMRTLRTIYE